MANDNLGIYRGSDLKVTIFGIEIPDLQTFWSDPAEEVSHIMAAAGPAGYNFKQGGPSWRVTVKATCRALPALRAARAAGTIGDVVMISSVERTQCLQATISKVDPGDQGNEASDVTIEGLSMKNVTEPRA